MIEKSIFKDGANKNLTHLTDFKGITLIALVITIIILMILAAVSINVIMSDGIIKYAVKSSEEFLTSKMMEEIELAILDYNMDLSLKKRTTLDGTYDIKNIDIDLKENTPDLGWIYIKNRQIVEYGLYYQDYYVLNVNGNIIKREFDYSTLINVKDYGALGDGKTDDTSAIREAISHLNTNGGMLYFPTGEYIVSVSANQESIMTLESDKKVEIDFLGSTIKLKENKYPSYNVIEIKNCLDAEIRDGFLIGDRINHDYTTISTTATGAKATHEFGYGVFLSQTTSGNVYNMEISQMTGDAIINQNGTSGGNTTINLCTLHHCRRQGISVLDSDIIEIKNTEIYNIGTFDGINGTAPMSGIDLEPDSGTFAINSVNIDNVKIHDNTSFGLVSSKANVTKLNVLNSEMDNISLASLGNFYNTTINYNMETSFSLNGVYDKCYFNLSELGTKVLYISSDEIYNSTFAGGEGASIYFSNTSVLKNTTFNNFLNKGKVTSVSSEAGIIYKTGYVTSEESCDNIYNNCTFYFDRSTFAEANSIIKNSNFICWFDCVFKNIRIENCDSYVGQSIFSVEFDNCNVEFKKFFVNSVKKIYNSYVCIDATKTVNDFYIKSVCENSTIRVKGDCLVSSFYSVNFSNSNIILDKYNSKNKLITNNSVVGTDYTVEYNGEEKLSN